MKISPARWNQVLIITIGSGIMKKIILAAMLTAASHLAYANTDPTAQFEQIEAMITAQDFKGAYNSLNQLANQGNAQAIYNLAYLTQTGQGTNKDEKKAIQLYQQSADKGYPVAHYVLGKNYAGGTLGLPQDLAKAKQHFKKASDLKFDDATVDYAVLLFSESKPESDKEALAKLNPLIQKGNYQAIHAKALYDISSGFKTQQEAPIQQGIQSIQELAGKGYIPALMAVANMLANGSIVQQNLPEARKIFAELAKSNIPQAKESVAAVDKMMAEQKKTPTKKS